jgi:hypothetical protein
VLILLGSDEPSNFTWPDGYSYAGNNPVTTSDPTGMCAEIDCPTRPGPGYENTTPGKVPGPPKKSGTSSVVAGPEKPSSEPTPSPSPNAPPTPGPYPPSTEVDVPLEIVKVFGPRF